MGSYESLPTSEYVPYYPQSRKSFFIKPFFGCGFLLIFELIAYNYCRQYLNINLFLNAIICVTSMSFGTFMLNLYECLVNFNTDSLVLTITFGIKLVLSVLLVYWYNLAPYLDTSNCNIVLFYVIATVTFVYLRYFKTNSWNSICNYSTKNPPLGETLAHQTYEGYYAKILPKIRKEIKKLSKEDNIPANSYFITLLPRSGLQTQQLIDHDTTNNLEIVDGPIVISENNGGTVNREYKITKYKIQRQNDKSKFYCFFEVPSSLGNMYKIVRHINDNKEYMDEQYQMYHNTLRDCIENDNNCVGNYKIVAYNDLETESGSSLPLSLILEKIVDGKERELDVPFYY